MKERYLLDEYIISKFLGVGIEDPAIDLFLKKVREMMYLLVSNFLFDYSVLRNISIDTALAAYNEYLGYIDGSLSEPDEKNSESKLVIYKILGDKYFYDELEKRVDEYIGKIYKQYVPLMSEADKDEVDEYIKTKANEKSNNLDQMIAKVNNAISEIEVMEVQLESKLDQMRKLGGTNRIKN